MTTTTYTLTTNTATATYTVTGESPELSIAGDFGGGLAFVQVDLNDGLGWIDDASTSIARRFSVGVKPGAKLRVRLQDSDAADLDISIVDAATSMAVATSIQIANDVTDGTNNWDDGKPALAMAVAADTEIVALRTNAATAATEIGKVPRLSTPIAAGASARRTKGAATATTLDETLGATP